MLFPGPPPNASEYGSDDLSDLISTRMKCLNELFTLNLSEGLREIVPLCFDIRIPLPVLSQDIILFRSQNIFSLLSCLSLPSSLSVSVLFLSPLLLLPHNIPSCSYSANLFTFWGFQLMSTPIFISQKLILSKKTLDIIQAVTLNKFCGCNY